MGHVVIGMDPHKRSATIEIIDGRQTVLFAGRGPHIQRPHMGGRGVQWDRPPCRAAPGCRWRAGR